jgi:hypothetical protein
LSRLFLCVRATIWKAAIRRRCRMH